MLLPPTKSWTRTTAPIAVLLSTIITPAALARTSTLISQGGNVPNDVGNNDGNFSDLGIPVLNNLGQAGFAGDISGSASTSGVFRATEAGIEYIAREGDAFGVPSVVLGNDIADHRVSINNAGQIAFVSRVTTTDPGSDTGIFRGDATGFQRVVRENQIAPSNDGNNNTGVIQDLLADDTAQTVRINDAGQIVFYEDTIISSGFFRYGDVNGLIDLSREGDSFRDAEFGSQILTEIGSSPIYHFNNLGQIAFYANEVNPDPGDPCPPISGLVLMKADENDGSLFRAGRLIIEEGDTVDPGNFPITILVNEAMAFNDAGQIGIVADGSQSTVLDRLLIMDRPLNGVPDSSQFTVLVEDALLPDGTGTFDLASAVDRRFVINGAGQLLANIVLDGTTGGFSDNSSLIRIDPGQDPLTIVREDDSVPGGDGNIASFRKASINAHGVVAFEADLRNTLDGTDTDRGVFITDGEETIQAVRKGQAIGGFATLTDFEAHLGSGGQDGMQNGFNDFGQFVYLGTEDGFLKRIFLFTPEINWRRSASGNWDDNDNWTLSLPPGHPHDVTIGPSGALTVNGPTVDTTVQSLTLGGNNGTATLSLAGGVITSTQAVQVLSKGILTGDGTINGDVDNHGTVLADNVTVTGTLTNHHTITGNGFVNGTVVNTADGTIEAIGHDLGFDGTVTNASGGLISARNALLRFEGTGLINQGRFGFSFGTSDVFGDVDNDGGQIIIQGTTNVTFWDDVVNDGALIVDADSRVVFFGMTSGSGSFPGSGEVVIQGTLSPGNSPGEVSVSGDLTLGAGAELVIELGGIERGEQYDAIDIAGQFSADGTLTIELLDGFTPQLGDTFDLLDFASITGGFDAVRLPALGGGVLFDTHALLTTGTLTVVPEPTTLGLIAMGLLSVATRRRAG